MDKQYLGDAVYVEWDEEGQSIRLTTEDSIDVTNEIFLEPEVWDNLLTWVTSFQAKLKQQQADRK